MIKALVIGHEGQQGRELVKRIKRHPVIELNEHTLSKKNELTPSELKADMFFLGLPPGVSEQYIPQLDGKIVIDVSPDHRYVKGWDYGSPELNREKIKVSDRIAVSGCYANSIILGLAPLRGKVYDVNIASISGISGAGKDKGKEDNFEVYNEVREHYQIKEIEKTLGLENIIFIPERIHTAYKGITSKIFARYDGNENLEEMYKEFYKNEPFVRIKENIETKNVNGTNYCDIKIARYGDWVVIISALDNLLKGGAGQAIQNANIRLGLDERMGLI